MAESYCMQGGCTMSQQMPHSMSVVTGSGAPSTLIRSSLPHTEHTADVGRTGWGKKQIHYQCKSTIIDSQKRALEVRNFTLPSKHSKTFPDFFYEIETIHCKCFVS